MFQSDDRKQWRVCNNNGRLRSAVSPAQSSLKAVTCWHGFIGAKPSQWRVSPHFGGDFRSQLAVVFSYTLSIEESFRWGAGNKSTDRLTVT